MARGAFYTHVAEAIAVNRARRPVYARLSGGRSDRLSRLLIWLERGTLFFARWLDWRAKKWNRRGIPVMHDDFVSMEDIRPAETPPRLPGRTPAAELEALDRALAAYRDALRAAARAADFEAAAKLSYDLLADVERREEATEGHLTMTKHILESIGLAALNARRYAEASAGGTVALSKSYLKIQALGLAWPVRIDRMAQEIHALGVGIIVNDIPDIPFKRKWETRTEP